MSGQLVFVGETEFSRVDVEVLDRGPDEWAEVNIGVSQLDGDSRITSLLTVTMDEARVIIAGLAAVIQ